MKGKATSNPVEYTVLLVDKERKLYTELREGRHRLPRIPALRVQRVASEIQLQVEMRFDLRILVLDILGKAHGHLSCAVAYLVSGIPGATALIQTSIDQIAEVDLSEDQRRSVTNLLCDRTDEPLCRIGWFEDAMRWVESVVGAPLGPRVPILQLNAGNGFMLLRLTATDGRQCWLKATGEPNRHELPVTKCLCSLVDTKGATLRPVPLLYDIRLEWNAWLLSGEGSSLSVVPTTLEELYSRLREAVTALARLQFMSSDHAREFLKHGAFDHRVTTWSADAHHLCDFLDELIRYPVWDLQQRDGKIKPGELAHILQKVLEVASDSKLTESLLHGDLNWGNLVFSQGCQLIDWSEARVGYPLVSLWHLLMLVPITDEGVRRALHQALFEDYCQVWSHNGFDISPLKRVFRYAPFLSAFSALHARGDWLDSREPASLTSVRRILPHLLREASILRQAGAV